jgi:hypothetical protein
MHAKQESVQDFLVVFGEQESPYRRTVNSDNLRLHIGQWKGRQITALGGLPGLRFGVCQPHSQLNQPLCGLN